MNPARIEKQAAALSGRLADLADANRMAAEQAVQQAREIISRNSTRQQAGSSQEIQERGAIHFARNCLNGGEMSPEMGGRFDQQRYAAGCHLLRNMVPLPCGGVRKRPGLLHCGWSAASGEGRRCRLVPFIFSASESRILEIAEGSGQNCVMRVWRPDGTMVEGVSLRLPFSAEVGMNFTYTQSADVIFIAHKKIRPGKIMRYGDNDWRYERINWLPAIQAPQWERVEPAGDEPSNESRRISVEYVCTAIDAETGEESAPSAPYKLTGQYPLTESRYIELVPVAREDIAEYRIYKKSAGVYGYIGSITEAEEDGSLLFEDKNIAPDTEDTPPRAQDHFAGDGNYPGVVFLHQQRLGYAATENRPLTVWLSQAGNFESMAASVPPDADDAIEATLAASQANSILWAVSDRSGLVLGTEGGEWIMQPAEGAALTPSDLSFQPQTSYGSQPGLVPVIASSGVIFAQRGGHAARFLGYSFQDDRYNASDLSVLARHMLAGHAIVSWAWQQEPYGILWCVLANGTMAACTWLREHDVIAWHRHDTNGKIESVACIPAENGANICFFTVLRPTESGSYIRAIERLAEFSNDMESTRHTDGEANHTFQARCIPCLPETSLDNGSSYLAVRKINAVKAQVLNSRPFRARVISQDGRESPLVDVPARACGFIKKGNWACPLGGGWREDASLELVFDGPDPVTVLGMTVTMELADERGGQK